MHNLSILFLGWDFLPDSDKEPEINCYEAVKALANQLDLSLLLPKADSKLAFNNIKVTGLNNVDFKSISSKKGLPKVQPFLEANYIRSEIPLYGSPNIPENQRFYSEERSKIMAVAPENSFTVTNTVASSQEAIDFFHQIDWDNITVDSKIIHYARFATRFASDRSYDVIFASNWLTYLAGHELHLITGKPLAIQLNTLSQDHRELNNQGWRYELEKMVIEQSDYIFTCHPVIAHCLEEAYSLSRDKLVCLEEPELVDEIASGNSTSTNLWQNQKDQEIINFIPMDRPLDWERQANKIVQVLTKSYA
jgi:glycogen(starch) synthase